MRSASKRAFALVVTCNSGKTGEDRSISSSHCPSAADRPGSVPAGEIGHGRPLEPIITCSTSAPSGGPPEAGVRAAISASSQSQPQATS